MKLVFHKGSILDKDLDKVSGVAKELRGRLEYMHSLKGDDLIGFFDALAKSWEKDKELEKEVGGSLKHLAAYIKKGNLEQMMGLALHGNRKALDEFVDFGHSKYRQHCQPHGLIVHWLPGNVALIGFYSLVQATLTKNVSLAKASAKAYKPLLALLESIKGVDAGGIKGSELVQAISVLLVDDQDRQGHEQLSLEADARVMWGSEKAIRAVSSLEKDVFCGDIVFGPKYSYGAIGRESLKDYKKIALRVAFDVCTFDQYACSSPHTIFVQETKDVSALRFAEELAKNVGNVAEKFIPKEDKDEAKNLEILKVRAKGSMKGKVFASKDTGWTVVYSEEPGLEEACASRVVFVKPVKDLLELAELNDRHKQSLGLALEGKDREEIVDRITRKGIDRCVRFGEMTLYESPWDGFFPMDRMVRWVSLYKER